MKGKRRGESTVSRIHRDRNSEVALPRRVARPLRKIAVTLASPRRGFMAKMAVKPPADRSLDPWRLIDDFTVLRPSVQPSSPSRCTKAAVHWLWTEGVFVPKNPMVGSFPCARAASGRRSDRATPTPSFDVEAGLLDPRRVIPKDWEYVNGSGHNSFFTAQMQGVSADHFTTIREFGAIGNELCYAVGVAAARPDKPIILTCGDGGPLADIAKGFGLQGATITSLDQISGLLEEFKASKEPTLWEFHNSDQVVSPMMRRGVMRPR